jgi:hypothetical protein
MRFGPFPREEVPKLEEILKKAGLSFEVCADTAETVFVDIPDEDLERLAPELEEAGFSLGLPVPDFHNQDFVCPKCELSQETPGTCPKDGEKLLEFSDFVAHKKAEEAPSPVIFYAVMGVVVALIAAYAIWS